jgi:hypothetical protein
MKHRLHRLAGLMPVVALTGALFASPVGAQTTAQAWPPAASVPALQARMQSIREATDPERRMALMEEQIKALDAASQGGPAGCPMMGGPMMGGQMGGMMMNPKLMQEHMQMMQQHMGMMENMMKMHHGMPPAAPN